MNTPVALLIFRRPDLTEQVFAAIAAARPPLLLVISDWPTQPTDQAKCLEARRIATQVTWPCEVRICFASEHMGCKLRVSSGLDWVFSQVEEAIILEDDCLPHPTFFRFCEEMLAHFRNDGRIGHISGSNFQKGFQRSPYSYYFSRHMSIWGWATWRRAWRDYDVEMRLWPQLRDAGWQTDMLGSAQEARRLEAGWNMVHAGQVDTWDSQWHFCRLSQGTYGVTPNVNLISNLGFRSDALHTRYVFDPFAEQPLQEMTFPLAHPPYVICDDLSDQRYAELAFPIFRFHPRRIAALIAARFRRVNGTK